MGLLSYRLLSLFLLLTCMGCANITAPTGGKRDLIPPKLLHISPADSLKNTRVSKIELNFDEYITVSDAIKEVQISPLLTIAPTVTGLNKHVIVKIVDSLLEDSTTYRLSFGNAIKDVHEGNAFSKYTYTFSTCSYFDSLMLKGNVINAATGLPDTGGVMIELYAIKENDSAVVRHKPKYVTRCDNKGKFVISGLPKREFRIYALKDDNSNLIYDGGNEMIAFNNQSIWAGDTSAALLTLRLFTEIADTTAKKSAKDSLKSTDKMGLRGKIKATNDLKIYSVNIDTGNISKRTFDVNKNIVISFAQLPQLNKEKISLAYEKDGAQLPALITYIQDTAKPNELQIKTNWLENTVYTLRLAKGFAKDTANVDIVPSKYIFHTLDDEDYGKIVVNLPSKYSSSSPKPDYLLMVNNAKDTVYLKAITDTNIRISRLVPDKYTFRVIADKNHNGKWDTGDLFGKLQPEEVIPYSEPVVLRPGWDNTIDFEPKKVTK